MKSGECALNSPVDASDRIESLDVLRGLAVLGILVWSDAELLAYRDGWFAQQARRSTDTLEMHTTAIPIKLLWQSAG